MGWRTPTRRSYWSVLWQMTIRTISMRSSSSALHKPSSRRQSRFLTEPAPDARSKNWWVPPHAGRRGAHAPPSKRQSAGVSNLRVHRQRRAPATLDGLVGHVDELWQQVEALVATKRQTDYDAAVKVIQDLHDLATRRGQLDIFAPRLQQLRARHAKKVSLLDRLDSAPLT